MKEDRLESILRHWGEHLAANGVGDAEASNERTGQTVNTSYISARRLDYLTIETLLVKRGQHTMAEVSLRWRYVALAEGRDPEDEEAMVKALMPGVRYDSSRVVVKQAWRVVGEWRRWAEKELKNPCRENVGKMSGNVGGGIDIARENHLSLG